MIFQSNTKIPRKVCIIIFKDFLQDFIIFTFQRNKYMNYEINDDQKQNHFIFLEYELL